MCMMWPCERSWVPAEVLRCRGVITEIANTTFQTTVQFGPTAPAVAPSIGAISSSKPPSEHLSYSHPQLPGCTNQHEQRKATRFVALVITVQSRNCVRALDARLYGCDSFFVCVVAAATTLPVLAPQPNPFLQASPPASLLLGSRITTPLYFPPADVTALGTYPGLVFSYVECIPDPPVLNLTIARMQVAAAYPPSHSVHSFKVQATLNGLAIMATPCGLTSQSAWSPGFWVEGELVLKSGSGCKGSNPKEMDFCRCHLLMEVLCRHLGCTPSSTGKVF